MIMHDLPVRCTQTDAFDIATAACIRIMRALQIYIYCPISRGRAASPAEIVATDNRSWEMGSCNREDTVVDNIRSRWVSYGATAARPFDSLI